MAKLPSEILNDFVAESIEPLCVNNEEVCDATSILDWIMQKQWASTLRYQSWPDGNYHTVKEGLTQVFETINHLDSAEFNMRCKYNQFIYDILKQTSDDTAAKAMAFDKIKAIVGELEH